MKNLVKKLFLSDEGATAVEYAVMLALILISVISAISVLGAKNGGLWTEIDSDLKANGFG